MTRRAVWISFRSIARYLPTTLNFDFQNRLNLEIQCSGTFSRCDMIFEAHLTQEIFWGTWKKELCDKDNVLDL